MKDNNTDYQNDNSRNNSNISLSMAVISVIATLLPIIIGLALWNKLPDELPVHWGIKGNVDRLATKAEGIFIMPCLCAIIQIGVNYILIQEKSRFIINLYLYQYGLFH